MGDAAAVMRGLRREQGVIYPVLAPNLRGYNDAISSGATHVAVFTSASESFAKKNINCTIEESMARSIEVCKVAAKDNIKVRGYVSLPFIVCFLFVFMHILNPLSSFSLIYKAMSHVCWAVLMRATSRHPR
jgi:isopropylmalate/homocitrate/citramalate synthase